MSEPGSADRHGVRCAASFSAHPDPAMAVGEVVGGVLDRLDPHPDVAIVAMSGPQAAELDRVVAAIRTLLAPEAIIGSTARAVFAGPQDLSAGGGLMLWAGRGTGLRALALPADRVGTAWSASGVSPGDVVLLLASPAFAPGELATAHRSSRTSGAGELGGLTSVLGVTAPRRAAGVPARLTDGDRVVEAGAFGVTIPGSAARLVELEVVEGDEIDDLADLPDPAGRAVAGNPDAGAGPAGSIVGGAGALLLVDHSVRLSPHWELTVAPVMERFGGTSAGIVGAVFSLGPGGPTGHHDPRRTSVLVIE